MGLYALRIASRLLTRAVLWHHSARLLGKLLHLAFGLRHLTRLEDRCVVSRHPNGLQRHDIRAIQQTGHLSPAVHVAEDDGRSIVHSTVWHVSATTLAAKELLLPRHYKREITSSSWLQLEILYPSRPVYTAVSSS